VENGGVEYIFWKINTHAGIKKMHKLQGRGKSQRKIYNQRKSSEAFKGGI